MNRKGTLALGSLGVLVAVSMLSGCGAKQNAQPCEQFAASYNKFADQVEEANRSGNSDQQKTLALRKDWIDLAGSLATGAEGAVKVALQQVFSSGTTAISQPSDDNQVANLMSAQQVSIACKADGVEISLHNTR